MGLKCILPRRSYPTYGGFAKRDAARRVHHLYYLHVFEKTNEVHVPPPHSSIVSDNVRNRTLPCLLFFGGFVSEGSARRRTRTEIDVVAMFGIAKLQGQK